MNKILITGATGNLGKAVANELIAKGVTNVSVMARDLQKAEEFKAKGIEVVYGDYNDYDSLVKAFTNIDKLYFVSASDVAQRYAQQENVVKAATEAGVKHIIYTSAQRKREDGTSVIAFVIEADLHTEALIKESGMTYTILKHGLYTELLPLFMGESVIETGVYLPAGMGKAAYISRNDLATAGATIITTEGHENKTYEFGGATAYSFQDIADMLTELSGKTIIYPAPSVEEFTEQMKGYGLSEEEIEEAAGYCIAIAQDEFDFPSTKVEELIGRPTESVKAYLKAAYNL